MRWSSDCAGASAAAGWACCAMTGEAAAKAHDLRVLSLEVGKKGVAGLVMLLSVGLGVALQRLEPAELRL